MEITLGSNHKNIKTIFPLQKTPQFEVQKHGSERRRRPKARNHLHATDLQNAGYTPRCRAEFVYQALLDHCFEWELRDVVVRLELYLNRCHEKVDGAITALVLFRSLQHVTKIYLCQNKLYQISGRIVHTHLYLKTKG